MGADVAAHDAWSSGDAYERYVGRWSRLVAQEFIGWLAIPEGRQWLDVGCGTGVLSRRILEETNPKTVMGIDRSDDFVSFTRSRIGNPNTRFETGDAQALPVESESFDVVVSGLVLNFVPQPAQMIAEMMRAVRKDGTVALYVWDYAGEMQFLRHFWDAAVEIDPAANNLDESKRFQICDPGALAELFQNAGLQDVQTRAIDIATNFQNFDDYWVPFLGGQGPAPGYLMSLSEERRAALRERIYNGMPFAPDGSIPLVARAWAIRGTK
jgi:ubiquinone/menaquinone biosynthesis C-methylase UbiE